LEIQSLRDELWNFPGFILKFEFTEKVRIVHVELLIYASGDNISDKNPTSCPQGTHPPDGSQINQISELQNRLSAGRQSEKRDKAIYRHLGCGPTFGGVSDIYVSDNCSANNKRCTSLCWSYTNNTGLDGRTKQPSRQILFSKRRKVFAGAQVIILLLVIDSLSQTATSKFV
jgi:hypothetical protein